MEGCVEGHTDVDGWKFTRLLLVIDPDWEKFESDNIGLLLI